MNTKNKQPELDDDRLLTLRESEQVRLLTLIHGAQAIAVALEQESTPGELFSQQTANRLRALQWQALDDADSLISGFPLATEQCAAAS